MKTTNENMREGFERHALNSGLDIAVCYNAPDLYKEQETRIAWLSWQAALTSKEAGDGWKPIDTAPHDNKHPLLLARFVDGKLREVDFNGAWEQVSDGGEDHHIKTWYDWTSEQGIENPTHWAYQVAPNTYAAPQPQNHSEDVRGLAACVTCGQPVEQPEAVEPVAWVDDGGLIFWKDGVVPDGTDIYTLSPTASQALRMAADVCDKHIAHWNTAFPGECSAVEFIKQEIEALIPPISQGDSPTLSTFQSDQRKLGFAEGVKALAALAHGIVDHAAYYDEDDSHCQEAHARIDTSVYMLLEGKITPPTDKVTMTREELAAISGLVDDVDGLIAESRGVSGLHLNGDDAPWDSLTPGGRFERLSNIDAVRTIIAQHVSTVGLTTSMPKESK